MNKFGIAVIAIGSLALSSVAAPARPASPVDEARRAALKEEMMKKSGGLILQPGSAKGRLVFADAQAVVDASNIVAVVEAVKKQLRYETVYAKTASADPTVCKSDLKADVLVLAVDDATLPALVVAPEERWAKVNVAKLDAGLQSDSAKAKFVAPRLRKELLRAFAYAAGGANSQFPDNIMQAKSLADLDLCKEFIPGDTLGKMKTFLKQVDVIPANVTTYRKACREGWAPAPTNDVQKAVWDQVHEIPTDPIKIKFDPKTDTK